VRALFNGNSVFCLMATFCLMAPASPVAACTVPVFRYALERWPADPYEAVIFHRGPFGPQDQAIADALRQAADSPLALANLTVNVVDVAGQMDDVTLALWQAHKDRPLPRLVLRYPDTPADAPPAWAGLLSSAEVRDLIDSPARRQLAWRLLKGESVVWLLIECGNKARDAAAARLLTDQLAQLQKTLQLPEVDENDPQVQGPPLRSSLPLRLVFSQLALARHDPAERIFVSMLLNTQPNAAPADEPAIIPVFGRGRALGVLSGKAITPDNLSDAAAFLTGQCSCLIKEQNPGIDLLLAADWDGALADGTPKEPRIPPIPILAASPPGDMPAGPRFVLAAIAGAALLLAAVGAAAVLRRQRTPAP
jgi:hypothetical protein